MKWWISKDSVVSKLGIAAVILMVIFGIAGSMQRARPQNAAVQPASSQTASANTISLSEKPKIAATETRIETTEEAVPFDTVQTYDGTLPKDSEVVRVDGAAGKKLVKNAVKIKDGVEISRELVSETVTVPPVSKVVAIGTKIIAAANKQTDANGACDTHYSPCVKKLSDDIDCKSIGHPVRIVTPGVDPYNLDNDNDGVGCDNFPAH